MKGLKQWLSLVLVCCLLVGIFPVSVLAADSNPFAVDNGEPQLLTLTVEDRNGDIISLLEDKPTVLMGESYTFSATFSNSSKIRQVYITSTKENGTKYLEAVWDGSAFKTQGFFDNDVSYIPGKIGVEYTENIESININEGIDISDAEQALRDMTSATITSSSGEDVVATVDISKLLENEAEVAVGVAVDVFDASTNTDTASLKEWLGIYEDLEKLPSYAINGSDYFLYLDYSDTATYAMILRDVSGNKYFKMICKKMGDSYDALSSLANSLGTIKTVSGLTYDFLSLGHSADELRRQIAGQNNISDEVKSKLYNDVDAYEKDRQLFTLTMAIIPAVTVATGGTMTAPTILLGALLSVLNAAADTFWEYRVGMITEFDETLDTDFVHGTPLTWDLLENGELTQGGTYCLVGGSPSGFTMNNISVDLCLHDHYCGITNNGGNLTVRDCTYSEESSTGYHANVQSNGGTVEFDYCSGSITMTDNGTVSVYGSRLGSAICTDSAAYIYDTRITGRVQNTNGSLTLDNAIVPQIKNTAGTMEIVDSIMGSDSGGLAITNDENGTVTINRATIIGYDSTRRPDLDFPTITNISGAVTVIDSRILSSDRATPEGVAIKNYGTVEVLGGEIIGRGSEGDGYCVWNAGMFTVQRGTFAGTLENAYDGELIINNGIFESIGTDNLLNRSNGTITINEGTFRASNGSNVVTRTGNLNYLPKTTINGGIFYADGGNCVQNEALIVSDLVVSPKVAIYNGIFFSDNNDTVYNSGAMSIHGGFFYANYDGVSRILDSGCIRNGSRANHFGVINIDGGTFLNEGGAYCVYTPNEDGLTISNGQFLSSSDGIHGGTCNVLIGADSDVLIYANYGISTSFCKSFDTGYMLYATPVSLVVAADMGYSGGVKHYDSISSTDGTVITFAQANNLNISAPFLRLTGANIFGGADIVETPSLIPKQDIAFSAPTSLNKTYGDPAFTNAATNATEGGGQVSYTSSDKDVATVNPSGEVTINGAGETVITATAASVAGQYAETSISYTLTVNPKPISIVGATVADKVYDGTIDASVTGITFDGVVAGDILAIGTDYTANAMFSDANAGAGKDVTVEITMNSANYSLSSGTFKTTATISKAKFPAISGNTTLHIEAGRTREIDLSKLAGWPGDFGAKLIAEVESGAGLTASIRDTMLTLTSEGVKDAGDTDTVTVSVSDAVNYENGTVIITVTYAEKEVVVIDGITVSDKVYDGKAASYMGDIRITNKSTGNVVTLESEAIKYIWKNQKDGSVLEAAPASAGEYQLTIMVDGDDYEGELTVSFTISKAILVVRPADITIYVGNALPEEFSLIYAGFVNGETASVLEMGDVAPNFILKNGEEKLDSSKTTGSYKIEWTNKEDVSIEADNYQIQKEDGTLYIRTKSSSSSDSSNPSYQITVSATSNGTVTATPTSAKSGAKVTITATPNDGYTIGSVTVINRTGESIPVTDNGDGTFSFIMPEKAAQPVTVKVTFKQDGDEKDCPSEKFTDVNRGAWYHEAVDYVIEHNLMNGTGDTTFAPDSTTTRAMLVTILYRLEGEPGVATSDFTDVKAGQWYTDAVAWASANKIVEGYGNGTFGPEDPITREQMAVILYRYADYKGYDVIGSDDLSDFTDADDISSWAAASMRWAVAEDLIEGTSTTALTPTGDSTRAQVATILMRFCDKIQKQKGIPPVLPRGFLFAVRAKERPCAAGPHG